MIRTIFMALGLALPISIATATYTPSISIQHTFSAAGTATITINLGVAKPTATCNVSDPAAVWSLHFVDANTISLNTDRALDITCTFSPPAFGVTQ